jgi:rubredoxin
MGGVGTLADVVVLGSASPFRPYRTTTMSGHKRRKLAPSATPWDGIDDEELTPAQMLVARSHRSAYAFRHERFSGDTDFFNGYPRDSCPECGGKAVRFGRDRTGIQRFRCAECMRVFTPATGTIFEGRKLPLSAWMDFLVQVFSYASLGLMTREDKRSDTTIPYWMAKLLAVLEGVQDGAVLSGKVWIDETYWPVSAKDAVRTASGKLPRGLSRNQICIGVGVDDSGRSVFFREGLGKTNITETWAAFGTRIAPGSVLVHDLEPAHNKLVSELDLVNKPHNAKLLKGIPDDLNPLAPVNRMCFMLKSFLGSHSGFDRDSMQGYLDLFHVMMNPPENKMQKATMVLDRAMRCPKTVRFREFYNVKTRSEQ